MFLILASLLLALWAMFMAWKFYRRMDWEEPAEPSPDFLGMRKKQAQLQHIQEVLQEAHQEGKLSKHVVDEFDRYCETEEAVIKAAETAWKNRKPASGEPASRTGEQASRERRS